MKKCVIKLAPDDYYKSYILNGKPTPIVFSKDLQEAYIFKSKDFANYYNKNIVKNYYKDAKVVELEKEGK